MADAHFGLRGLRGLQLEHPAQAQPQHARTAHAKNIAPRGSKLFIAQIFSLGAANDQHGKTLQTGGQAESW